MFWTLLLYRKAEKQTFLYALLHYLLIPSVPFFARFFIHFRFSLLGISDTLKACMFDL